MYNGTNKTADIRLLYCVILKLQGFIGWACIILSVF